MCTAGGVEGNKTNHSLRSYGITTMYKHKVPKKVIPERSGHHSITALQVYERTTKEKMYEASRVLSANSNSTLAVSEDGGEKGTFTGCSFNNHVIKLHD